MENTLTILEVSQKQAYIFGSKHLRENAARSADISYVTGSEFFRSAAGTLYQEQANLVYSGGGHSVLQFESREQAVNFSKKVTEAALRQFNGMELFVTHLAYNPALTPGENLEKLSKALEHKKSLRQASIRQTSLGIEALDKQTLKPIPKEAVAIFHSPEIISPPNGWEFPAEFAHLSGGEKDHFIAVVHIDGNSMGRRVEKIYDDQRGAGWEACCRSLRRFSEGIQKDFESAFLAMIEKVIEVQQIAPGVLPIRPVVLAGDDVCFVTKGSIGLECARIFIEKLAGMQNSEGHQEPYAACAGVAIVHQKYPFHQAYRLAESLCSSAKKFGVALNKDGRVSAMDWHIEFGQMKNSLSDLRKDYQTEDGNRLEMRPLAVYIPDDCDADPGIRSYQFFRGMCGAMQQERGKTARGKLKDLRTAFKQGEVESRYFLHDKEITKLMSHAFDSEFQGEDEKMEQFRKLLKREVSVNREAFRQFPGEEFKRCLYFDAIELVDHWEILQEQEVEE